MTLDIEGSTSVDRVHTGQETTATGKVNFDIEGRTQDYPLHIVFCVDTSGSMDVGMDVSSVAGAIVSTFLDNPADDTKMDVAKAGLKKAVNQLSSDDTFGIVSFSSTASTELTPTNGGDTNKAVQKIDSMSAGGGTSIKSGLKKSRKLLGRMSNENAVEWIVLISDGQGSVPRDRTLKNKFSDRGITIQAAGVGDDYDRQQMLDLAQKTQGELEDIKSPKALGQFFKQEVEDAQGVVALDAEMKLDPVDFVSITEVYYSYAEQTSTVDPDWRGDTAILDLGDVNQDNPPEVTFEMDIEPSEDDFGLNETLVRSTLSTDNDSAQDPITTEVALAAGIEKGGDGSDEANVSGIGTTSRDPEFIIKKVSRLSQEGKISEARDYLEQNKDDLTSKKYQELKSMLDDNNVSGLSKA